MNWYGVKTVIKFSDLHEEDTFEERVTLWQANSFDDAIKKAEVESIEYASKSNGEYAQYANAFEMIGTPKNGCEVFSLMRESSLNSDQYLDLYHDTGKEKTN